MDLSSHLRQLLVEALADCERAGTPLSTAVRRAARIARLRGDFENLLWIEWEMRNIIRREEMASVLDEVRPHIDPDEFERLQDKFSKAWIDERRVVAFIVPEPPKPGLQPYKDPRKKAETTYAVRDKSIPELETQAADLQARIADTTTPSNLKPDDARFVHGMNQGALKFYRHELSSTQYILDRIRNRIHSYLGDVERQLAYGQVHADIFEANRRFVELRLGELSPDALQTFIVATRRLGESDDESRAQALVSCRRLLEALADALYPPSSEPVQGRDGRMRELTQAKYIARLWQFAMDAAERSTSAELWRRSAEDLGRRIDKVYELTNKGVHDKVDLFEAQQCIMQTYLVIGDLLRMKELHRKKADA